MTDDNKGPFSLGDPRWPGLAKLAEESAEVIQVITKLLATDGDPEHWSGEHLARRLEEELGDLFAAGAFVIAHCDELDSSAITGRELVKRQLFERWRHGDGAATFDPADVGRTYPLPANREQVPPGTVIGQVQDRTHVRLTATDSAEATLRQLDHAADTFTSADPDADWYQARCASCGWHTYPTQDQDLQERWRALHVRDNSACWPVSSSTVMKLPR